MRKIRTRSIQKQRLDIVTNKYTRFKVREIQKTTNNISFNCRRFCLAIDSLNSPYYKKNKKAGRR